MKISDFKNKKVTVMGLGLVGGGVGVVKFLVKVGAKVLITDLKTKKQLESSLKKIRRLPVKLVLGKHRPQDFINTDLVIRNPGVPDDSSYLKIAEKNGVPIDNDVGIFFELCPASIIGVTGTKGKSTVVTLIHQFLKSKYPDVILAGNIGTSPLESLKRINKGSKKVVLELSSWQLEGLKNHKMSPQVALITNIYPEHLNRYKSLSAYINAKKIIFLFQKRGDHLFLNYDDKIVRRFSKKANSKVYFFSEKKIPKDLKKIIEGLKIRGEHNISNVLAAISVANLYKVPFKNIRRVLGKFRWLPGREEFIAEIKGVKYFNDTTATMPDAAIFAIKTLSREFPRAKIILIAGGQDKNLDYKKLTKEIKKNVRYLILFSGNASAKIKKGIRSLKISKKTFSIFPNINSMERAVKLASQLANRRDIVLLSPAAASFNLFKNEFDRGEQFNKFVKKLKRD
jgi:UDP-N-acetylmuramoylalanine--D-glutamate ligase